MFSLTLHYITTGREKYCQPYIILHYRKQIVFYNLQVRKWRPVDELTGKCGGHRVWSSTLCLLVWPSLRPMEPRTALVNLCVRQRLNVGLKTNFFNLFVYKPWQIRRKISLWYFERTQHLFIQNVVASPGWKYATRRKYMLY